jgi:hypothetical protein
MLGRDGPVTQRIFDYKIPDKERWLPDLNDAATIGCLIALARIIYKDNSLIIASIDYGPGGIMWQARKTIGGVWLSERHYPSEAEAIVAIFENKIK